jgi:hypothetical protein
MTTRASVIHGKIPANRDRDGTPLVSDLCIVYDQTRDNYRQPMAHAIAWNEDLETYGMYDRYPHHAIFTLETSIGIERQDSALRSAI